MAKTLTAKEFRKTLHPLSMVESALLMTCLNCYSDLHSCQISEFYIGWLTNFGFTVVIDNSEKFKCYIIACPTHIDLDSL